MFLPFLSRFSAKTRLVILAAFVSMIAALAGVSGLVFPSAYSPLLILGAFVLAGIGVAWLEKPVWALYATLFVIFLPLGLIPENVQSLLNRSLTVLAVVIFLLRLLLDRRKIVWTAPAIFILCFIGWGSVTLLWAENMSAATSELQTYLLRLLLFLFLIPNEITTKRDLDGLMKTLALIGWVLMLSITWTFMQQGYMTGSRMKIFSENENSTGVMAIIAMTGVLWQAIRPSQKRPKLGALAATIFMLFVFVAVATSGSRGSAISLALTIGVFWIWKPLRRWGQLAVLMTILVVVLVPSLFTTLIDRFGLQGTDTALGGREVLWQSAWGMIQDDPLGGVGIGNSSYTTPRYLQTDRRMANAIKASIHNPVLSVWSETAIPGIILYLGALFSALILFVREFLKLRKLGRSDVLPYFMVISSIFVGYMASWIKGGGAQTDFSYFLMLALLALPSTLDLGRMESVLPLGKTAG